MSYRDVMDMPLRSFWTFNANVVRLRAEEGLAQMELFLLGGFGVDGDGIKAVREKFVADMKEPLKVTQTAPKLSDEDGLKIHREGMDKLRDIAARMKAGS
jgi:hypothetical protein